MSSDLYDIAIIGGGILGLAVANALLDRKPALRLILLEAESHVGMHQTGHNSGVIHSGLYYKPGSLKARLCAEGRDAMYRFSEEHDIAHERCGKIVVATAEEELPRLEELYRRGTANGLTGLRWLAAEEIREYEPHAAGIRGLLVPTTGIIDYKGITRALGRIALDRGCEVKTSAKFEGCRTVGRELILRTSTGDVRSRALVNCGGLQSDRIAKICGLDPGVHIIPFRGEYYELISSQRSLVKNLIYPVPDPRFPFLGVHFTRMVSGSVEAGPNAVLAFKREGYRWTNLSLKDTLDIVTFSGFWRMAGRYWKTGAGEIWRSLNKRAFVSALQRLLPELQANDVEPAGSGVRAQAVDPKGRLLDDFHIVQAKAMIHVLNAPSPGATSSLSIGKTIAGMAAEHFDLN